MDFDPANQIQYARKPRRWFNIIAIVLLTFSALIIALSLLVMTETQSEILQEERRQTCWMEIANLDLKESEKEIHSTYCWQIGLEEDEIKEMVLDEEETINSVHTVTDKDTGRISRLMISTSREQILLSHGSKGEWDDEKWPQNQAVGFGQESSLSLAYCSGLDEVGSGGGRILNFHWSQTHND